MSSRTRLVAAAVTALTTAALLASCDSSSAPNPSTSAGRSSVSASPTPSVPPTPVAAVLPKTCGEMVSTGVIDKAVGHHLKGEPTFLNAKPLPSIGRTGRVTCGFGTAAGSGGSDADPVVKVSYITYDFPATATQRLQETLDSERKDGNAVAEVPVPGGTGYVTSKPPTATLFMADGVRTFVVSVKLSVVPAATANDVLAVITAPLVAFGGSASPSASPAATLAGPGG